MYTKLDDQNIAKKINHYLQLNLLATQKDICAELATTHYRLKMLEKDGLIDLQYTRRNFSSLS